MSRVRWWLGGECETSVYFDGVHVTESEIGFAQKLIILAFEVSR